MIRLISLAIVTGILFGTSLGWATGHLTAEGFGLGLAAIATIVLPYALIYASQGNRRAKLSPTSIK
ncbi:hypothetical protein IRY55_06720 [Savagea sp. SN6]|uniref:Uncharacterized protein n=1 Tax=Savagea serpentis TaxID=2785297 RepID=A0A8J7KSY8_9BACL|nr:hypothetical protein [Savagea serpentis]MBF4501054.1 hypothetical protein [Savagea serpentis]